MGNGPEKRVSFVQFPFKKVLAFWFHSNVSLFISKQCERGLSPFAFPFISSQSFMNKTFIIIG
jgi:hypothetical protein